MMNSYEYKQLLELKLIFYGVGSYRYRSDDMNWLEVEISNLPYSNDVKLLLTELLKKFTRNIQLEDTKITCDYDSEYSYPHRNYGRIQVENDEFIRREFFLNLYFYWFEKINLKSAS